MLAAERRSRILALAEQDGSVEIARLVEDLGVSHVTVRRDLDALVADHALEKVRGGAIFLDGSKLGSGRVTTGANGFTGAIGVVVPTSYYYRHIAQGIGAALERSGGEMRLLISNYDPDEERRLIAQLVEGGVAGLLVVPSLLLDDTDTAYPELISDLALPTVLVERELPGGLGAHLHTVRSAHERGVEAAMSHLRDLGHRRVAMVGRGRTQSAEFVRRGWREAVERHGFDIGSPMLGADELGTGPSWGQTGSDIVLERVLSTGATALFCHGDENSLLTLIHSARSQGIAIPDELSIIAYDDEISALVDPPLTAVSPDRPRVGLLATRLLLEQIEEAEPPTPTHIQVEPRLVVRASTRPPAAAAGASSPERRLP
ncbi:LacI family transcriptional regulator [Occultella glacieicola]|uniref:LacI family transcriptional regulator n=1 Tax=Occultella glacieicola TaxID=2518684 RepID=A0ABY2E0U5_9MICO|nr:LacI family DNA-binding transcriptional regulator [Occultella glacieicola]TDE90340.1 LacI family transcriptional regulator [Occultella glacieicola]